MFFTFFFFFRQILQAANLGFPPAPGKVQVPPAPGFSSAGGPGGLSVRLLYCPPAPGKPGNLEKPGFFPRRPPGTWENFSQVFQVSGRDIYSSKIFTKNLNFY